MIPSNRVFCDTGFLYASLARGDRYYDRAGGLLEQCSNQRVQMFSTWEAVSERITLLAYRLHPQAAVQFLDTMKPAWRWFRSRMQSVLKQRRYFADM